MIVTVTGRADDHELVLEQKNGGWQAILPPDLSDGQYVVTLTATNDTGKSTDYRGVLYLCAGVCKLTLQPAGIKFFACPQVATVDLMPPMFLVRLSEPSRLDVALRRAGFDIYFVRHWRC